MNRVGKLALASYLECIVWAAIGETLTMSASDDYSLPRRGSAPNWAPPQVESRLATLNVEAWASRSQARLAYTMAAPDIAVGRARWGWSVTQMSQWRAFL